MKDSPNYTFQIINRQLPWVLLGLLVIFLLDFYRGWFILLVGVGGVWVFSLFWARMLGTWLRFSREMRFGWAQVGDRLEERFTLTNLGWLPALWVEVIYHSNMPDYQPGRVVEVGGSSQHTWRSEGLCTRRGLFTLGPVTVQTGDPFGLFRTQLEFPTKTTILVAPPIVPLPEVDIAPGGRAGEGKARTYAREPTVSVAGVRDYQPEDSLRRIHWPTSIRKGSFFVRIFDHTPASDWFILLDLDKHIQMGQGFYSTEENGVIMAASLADRGLRAGHAVGLGVNGDEFLWLPPRYGEDQRQSIFQALALASPGRMSLSQLLEKGRSLFRYKPSLILITANSQGEWLDRLFPLMEMGIVPTALLIDAATYIPPVENQQSDQGSGEKETYLNIEEISLPMKQLMELLKAYGIVHYRFTRSFLDRPQARPGKQGHWQWSKVGSSRAILKEDPGDLSWRELN